MHTDSYSLACSAIDIATWKGASFDFLILVHMIERDSQPSYSSTVSIPLERDKEFIKHGCFISHSLVAEEVYGIYEEPCSLMLVYYLIGVGVQFVFSLPSSP